MRILNLIIVNDTACVLLKHMGVTDIFPVVYSHNTDVYSALEDENMLENIKGMLKFLK